MFRCFASLLQASNDHCWGATNATTEATVLWHTGVRFLSAPSDYHLPRSKLAQILQVVVSDDFFGGVKFSFAIPHGDFCAMDLSIFLDDLLVARRIGSTCDAGAGLRRRKPLPPFLYREASGARLEEGMWMSMETRRESVGRVKHLEEVGLHATGKHLSMFNPYQFCKVCQSDIEEADPNGRVVVSQIGKTISPVRAHMLGLTLKLERLKNGVHVAKFRCCTSYAHLWRAI